MEGIVTMYKRKILLMLFTVVFMITTFSLMGLSKTEKAESKSEEKKTEKHLDWLNYDEGLQKALSEKKPILINFYANWCYYCKKMDGNTFTNASVVEYLTENFIAIKVNTDEKQKLASKYKVRGLPTTWFLQYDATPIHPFSGYMPPDRFMEILKDIRAKHTTQREL